MTNTLKICEIFHSVQGEGINAGKPATFIRFFGCNLQCTWCDTKQSWSPDQAEFKTIEIQKVIEKIQSFDCPHIVFTGGEPTLFQDKISAIVKALPTTYRFELETNGSMPIEGDFWHTINISPKLSHSGNKPYEVKATGFPEVTWWKFVVEDEDSMAEIFEVQKKYEIPNDRIILMPQAQTKEALESKSPLVQTLCEKYGFKFGPRLHIALGIR